MDFIIKLDGKEIDIVTVHFVEPQEEGAFDHLPMGGAVKGLFAALVEQHRRDLDQLRCNMAYMQEIGLEPAEMSPEVNVPVLGEGDKQWSTNFNLRISRLLESGDGVWLVGEVHGVPHEEDPATPWHGTIWGHLNDEQTDADRVHWNGDLPPLTIQRMACDRYHRRAKDWLANRPYSSDGSSEEMDDRDPPRM